MLSADGIEAFLTPIEGDRPCGVDLRYDGVCSYLFEEPRGQKHEDFVDGKQIVVVDQPDWEKIDQDLRGALDRTRDLRLWILQLRAWTVANGLPGAARGLHLIASGIERFWDDLHPELDLAEPETEDQALRRLNALRALSDPSGFLGELRRAPLVELSGEGTYCLRDVDLANGRISPRPGDVVSEIGRIEAAFLASTAADLAGRADIAAAALADVEKLSAALSDRVGASQGVVDLTMLIRTLEQIRTLASEHANASKDASPPDVSPAADEVDGVVVPSGRNGQETLETATGAGPMNGALRNRDDVIAALDRILDYYRNCEPSSPIPILVERTRRLVPKDFLGLIEDLAPTAMKQIKEVGGIDGKAGAQPADRSKQDTAPQEGAS